MVYNNVVLGCSKTLKELSGGFLRSKEVYAFKYVFNYNLQTI